MRRSDRLFDIIQHLRTAMGPVTAATLAAELEVTPRTIYRDIATLQARRVPIDGAAGIGYVLRKSFDLPPLMFTEDEVEAIAIGARLVRRLRDAKLQEAADSVFSKVTVVLPEALRRQLTSTPFYVSPGDTVEPRGVDLADVRAAIRDSRKLHIAYADAKGRRTNRTIWPIAMAYYVDVTLVGAWCELRNGYRNFRVERIQSATALDEHFDQDNGRLFREWSELPKARPAERAPEPNPN
ncbi:helix-turn-helix transcriptional regulator [Reyranella sp.]|uniref:helix-turn-helix transcriptional regulator n=1 Tax=Reyranella sp. TaxID=1929291 RepID=UPI003D0E661A